MTKRKKETKKAEPMTSVEINVDVEKRNRAAMQEITEILNKYELAIVSRLLYKQEGIIPVTQLADKKDYGQAEPQ